ncbi:prolyl oligopeptidase family serine peptidase [Pelomonas sp. SE-A7]|uniref:alpha/beta hydrolase family protein n=1 Tax=Pelomonas sp. SE-A7 TaxID=3054953 RepID=UPI00259C86DA|nr:prolyl oligopeptidase family serine peptidase [Pelomonas sp. SE-A7]MDM4766347.1 prolyl oligopeptidase family serine peptidase [Pelomonas sp. SE-A7]
MNTLFRSSLALAVVLLTAGPGWSATDAAPAAKKPITHDVYAGWRSIQGSALSADGRFAAYALVGQESDGEIVVRQLSDGREWRATRGSSAAAAPAQPGEAPSRAALPLLAFSADGRYLAFAIHPSRAEQDKGKKEKKRGDDAPKPSVGLMDLATGKVETIERVKRFAWPDEGGAQLAVLLDAPVAKKEGAAAAAAAKADSDFADDDQAAPAAGAAAAAGARRKDAGTELILLDAASGKRTSFKDVADFAWPRNGAWLAYTVSVKDAPAAPARPASGASAPAEPPKPADNLREGVYVVNLADASARALITGPGSYKQLVTDREGRELAFISNRDALAEQAAAKKEAKGKDAAAKKDEPETPAPYKLFFWRSNDAAAQVLVSAGTVGMPAGWGPSEHASLGFSKDGQRLFLGTAELPKAEPKDQPEAMKVDLWHYKDPELQSAQKVKAERDKNRSYRAVVHLDGTAPRFVQLAGADMPNLLANDNGRWALGTSELPYRMLQSWDALYYDVYAVDLQTGAKRQIATKQRSQPRLSPGGEYAIGFAPAQKTWFAWRLADGQQFNLTGKIKARFENVERDVVEPADAYGYAGWTENDAAVVLYDQFDLWEVQIATQAARNLTNGFGRKHQLQLRYVPLETEDLESRRLPTDGLVLSAAHEVNRSTGFYKLPAGGGEPAKLLHANKLIGGLIKAKKADAVLFTQQSFVEFPDLWQAKLDLAAPSKISNANPQQSQYLWGTQEMMEFTSADGKKLKALVAKPENFDPKKKYPVMVYIYEKMTDNLHRYVPPAPAQNINVSRYVSNGYIVLRPDIVYTIGHPGKSAQNAVLPAVQAIVKAGYADEKRVGIQGHSWGAYQINYLITHSNAFRAAEAGASMANMISGYGGIRWGPGISRAFQYEQQQSRIGGTPWDSANLYIENSPIFQVHKVQTPFLTIHNDDDDAVPWYQAIEFFTALRRLGKEAYWFNYNGEKHGLRERDNMKHFTVHMGEFFDHYLKGAPRPEWMDKPVPYLEKGKRDVMPMFKPTAP